jgi:hypothetical protein
VKVHYGLGIAACWERNPDVAESFRLMRSGVLRSIVAIVIGTPVAYVML